MMRDCPDIEMRDALPDLVHGLLDEQTRARVEAHLAQCPDCSADLGILRAAARAVSPTTRVDVARIVAALPKAARLVPVEIPARRGVSPGILRMAAALGLAVLGAGLLRMVFTGDPANEPAVAVGPVPAPTPVDSVAGGDSEPLAQRPAVRAAPAAPPAQVAVAPRPTGLAMGGEVSDLSTSDLERLIAVLETLDSAPDAEPELVGDGLELDGIEGGEGAQ